MNIAIIGYGKMGKEIEAAAKLRNINVASIIDPESKDAMFKEITAESLEGADVAIDFTHPSAAVENIKKACMLKKNIVVGTTGWYERMDEVEAAVRKSGNGLIWSGNFSVGVNIFFRIAANAAKIIDKFDSYDVMVHEFHHKEKADSPSGTAAMIGKILTDNIARKNRIVTEELKRKIRPDEIHVSSTRGGHMPGTHIIDFDSFADTIELRHTVRSRQGLAIGALMAAEWLEGRKGFFTIDDFMKTVIGGN